MKLKTKFQDEDFELGEVVDTQIESDDFQRFRVEARASSGGLHTFYYDSIKEFTDGWEDDPEEPKEFWFIDEEGIIRSTNEENWPEESVVAAKSIGDYFETKEEAEKAVDKLKAFKRLKDKGFRLNHWKEAQLRPNMSCVSITGNMKVDEESKADLDLLFGGEE